MKIRVYNRFLDLLFEIDRYQSLQFKRSHHGISDFELHVNRYINGAEHLQKGNLVALGKQSNKVGIIQSKEIALDENGKESENFKLTGYSLEGLMGRRITHPPSHTSHDRISGSAESVMKHYVYNNFINTTDERKMPYFRIADNQGRGEHIKYESRYKTVSDELENISVSTGLGWTVYADFKNKELTFDVVETKDLTQGNRQGNTPVFFSPEFETIKSQEFIDSDLELRNVGYVGGQGEGVERKVVKVGDVAGWDRIETFVDARDIGNTTEGDDGEEIELTPEEEEELLIERGKDKMSEMETIFTLEAEILTPVTQKTYEQAHQGYRHPGQPISRLEPRVKAVTPFEYEKDFDLGDRVDVVNKSWNLKMTAPITEIIEVYEPSGFRIDATFGRSRPTLITKLKDKFDELEGIEKQEAPERVSVSKMNEAKKYARNQDVYVRQDAEKYTEDYTYPKQSIDNKDESVYQSGTLYTDQRMDQAHREIEDTKARVDQAVEDLDKADETINKATEDIKRLREELGSLPDNSEEINELIEKINAANERIDAANQNITDAQELIDSVTEDKDGQTVLKGTLVTNEIIAEDATLSGDFKGSAATINDLTTNDMTALNAIIQDAIIKGRLGANEATMLGLTTEEMTAINAIIQDAKITGNLNASDAIFQKGRFDEANIINAIIEKADIVDANLSGNLNIYRPDGAKSITNGMVDTGYTVVGNDPIFMTAGKAPWATFPAFVPGGTEISTSAHIYAGAKGTLDGRGLPDLGNDYEDVRDAMSAVAYQKYHFIHSARYLVFNFRKYSGATYSIHVMKNSSVDIDNDRLYFEKLDKDTSGLDSKVIDLGTPTYESSIVTFKIGWTNGWGDRTENIRFIMENVFLTDFID